MLDILQLRVNQDEIDQLYSCQSRQRSDGHAAFTVKGAESIWPLASWEAPAGGRINVRGWFPLLDKIADEFLLWWPQGGCIFVSSEEATYRRHENDMSGVLFLAFDVNRLHLVPPAQTAEPRARVVAGSFFALGISPRLKPADLTVCLVGLKPDASPKRAEAWVSVPCGCARRIFRRRMASVRRAETIDGC